MSKSIASCLLANRNERDQVTGGQTHLTYLFLATCCKRKRTLLSCTLYHLKNQLFLKSVKVLIIVRKYRATCLSG